jgi:HSP20 family protein
MLMRFDPFRDFDRRTEFPNRTWPNAVLAMDAYRRGQDFVAQFDLPGADPSTVDVSVEKNVLTVRAQRPATTTGEGDETFVSERRHGTFTRQLFLGDSLDTAHIQAAYDNGVLTITIPLAEQAQSRQIPIQNLPVTETAAAA